MYMIKNNTTSLILSPILRTFFIIIIEIEILLFNSGILILLFNQAIIHS